MLKTSFRKLDDYRIELGLEGEVTWKQSYKLEQAMNAVIGEYADVVIDISRVRAMDPTSAGLLMLKWAEGRLWGTTFQMVGLEDARVDLTLLVKLITTFDQEWNHRKVA